MFQHAADLRKKRIFISNDLTREEQAEKQTLSKFVPKLCRLNLKPDLRGTKILINGNLYDREYLERYIEENLKTDSNSLKKADVATALVQSPVWCNFLALGLVTDFHVAHELDISDHFPVILTLTH